MKGSAAVMMGRTVSRESPVFLAAASLAFFLSAPPARRGRAVVRTLVTSLVDAPVSLLTLLTSPPDKRPNTLDKSMIFSFSGDLPLLKIIMSFWARKVNCNLALARQTIEMTVYFVYNYFGSESIRAHIII